MTLRRLIVLVAIALLILFNLGAYGYLLYEIVNPTTTAERIETLKLFASVGTGIAILAGLLFTARTLQINQRTLELSQQNLRMSEETLQMQQRGQVAQRFTRAIDQLGALASNGQPRLELRLGGIHALADIANDPDASHFYLAILGTLTAYVRQNAPRRRPWIDRVRRCLSRTTEQRQPTADIQAIVDIIANRTPEQAALERSHGFRINLSQSDLAGAVLAGAPLDHAILVGADLTGADLRQATFHQADLRRAVLGSAELLGADFTHRADLTGTVGLTRHFLLQARTDTTTLGIDDLRSELQSSGGARAG